MATSTRPGDVLARRYRLGDLLSESGGGRFWRAQDLVLERYVALHVIADDDPRAPGLMEAARASAAVLDPRILRVLDADERDGLCYVVNEWGTGTSLDILVTHGGPVGPRRAAWLVAEVAAAVARAHAVGVAHGRLNPENVLIDRFGAIRLIGLCVDAALHGLPIGEPAIPTDRRDLGGLLHCALTATWPGPSASAVPETPVEHGSVLPPRRVRAGVPRALDDIWCGIHHANGHRRRLLGGHHEPDVSTAAAVSERLLEFLGDPTGLPEALAASIPPINEVRPVVLPDVPDIPVREPEPEAREPELDAPEPEAPRPPEPEAQATVAVETPAERTAVAGTPAEEPEPATEVLDRAEPSDDDEADRTDTADDTPATGPDTRRTGGSEAGSPVGSPAGSPTGTPAVAELPTEAGMPVFGDDGDVEWLRARRTPPPPPPPFEEPPERPLFAPDPPAGQPVRRPRTDVPPPPAATPPPPPAGAEYWPWESGSQEAVEGREPVPGRSWLRLAMALAAVVLLLMAVVVAFNLGRGRTPLGQERTEEASPTTSLTASPTPLAGVVPQDFDPQGDTREENREDVPLAVDGDPATTWPTSTYAQQLGPGGLKTGVGLLLDLGAPKQVAEVDLQLVGAPADASLYLGDAPPADTPAGEPVATATSEGDRLVLAPEQVTTARYVLVWFTALPAVDDGYRVEVAEVVVRGS